VKQRAKIDAAVGKLAVCDAGSAWWGVCKRRLPAAR
jgi:hypothetical protein